MGYSKNNAHVRADIFKPSGKWYQTVMLDMSGQYWEADIYAAIRNAMTSSKIKLEPNWIMIVLEPNHYNKHPVMLHGFETDET